MRSTQKSTRDIIPEDKVLFACARQNFLEAHQEMVLDVCREHEINWDLLFRTANLHGLAPLIYANLRQCSAQRLGIPPAVVNQFKQSTMQNMLSKKHMARNVSKAISYFGERSIDVMLIKGAALDVLVYDQPWYTAVRDADIVLERRRTDVSEKDHDMFEKDLHRSGVEFDYFEHHDVVMNGVIPMDFQRIWDEATKIGYRGHEVFVMSPEDMLLSVCINSCRKRFFRLKSLCDIAEIINTYPELQWREFVHKARAYDCNNIVYAALFVTQVTVGCGLPGEVLDDLGVSPVRAALIRHLTHYVSQHIPLASLYPFSGIKVFGRKANLSLILPYATYSGHQVRQKLREVYHAQRLQD